MSSAASEHPFPLRQPTKHWFLPGMLAPSLFAVIAMAFFQATGDVRLCSPTLLWISGAVAVGFCAQASLRESGPLHQRVYIFCVLLIVVYLQMLMPRLWFWPTAH